MSVASDDGDVIIAPVSARSNKSSQSQANLRTFSSAERERVEKDDTVFPLLSDNPEPTKRSDSLVTMNSNEEQDGHRKESTGLLHSGEFHDMVLPTRVERRPNSSQKGELRFRIAQIFQQSSIMHNFSFCIFHSFFSNTHTVDIQTSQILFVLHINWNEKSVNNVFFQSSEFIFNSIDVE